MNPFIACAPVRPVEGLPPYPNTHYPVVECPLCHELMYLGPRSKIMHERDGVPIMCMVCALSVAKLTGDDLTPVSLGGP